MGLAARATTGLGIFASFRWSAESEGSCGEVRMEGTEPLERGDGGGNNVCELYW